MGKREISWVREEILKKYDPSTYKKLLEFRSIQSRLKKLDQGKQTLQRKLKEKRDNIRTLSVEEGLVFNEVQYLCENFDIEFYIYHQTDTRYEKSVKRYTLEIKNGGISKGSIRNKRKVLLGTEKQILDHLKSHYETNKKQLQLIKDKGWKKFILYYDNVLYERILNWIIDDPLKYKETPLSRNVIYPLPNKTSKKK